ncbi:hypothetical protein PUR49_32670 [Streptomyces sp. BE147]|uniref:hypothetical protein n=1 Tax=Streptomyces sp. BE147 TaxID=3002524 RepID=UPI002E78BBAF|nr:hypothetical protein [Streptomyces sp. BE147]MEE1741226.1 hypothetical protein [Streptomyces sp. BE147]
MSRPHTDPARAVDLPSWTQTVRAQRAAAQEVARLVADTLLVHFPQAAYFVLDIDYDRDLATDLFPNSIRDPQGQILTDFASHRLPPLPAGDPLRARWGSYDPTDIFQVRHVLRTLRLSGGEFDDFPEELRHVDRDDEGYIPCLLLSPQARPERWARWDAEDDDRERLLRPYSAPRPPSGTAGPEV